MTDRSGAGPYVAILMSSLLGLFSLIWVYTATQRINFLPEESGPWRAHIQMIERCDGGRITVLGSSRANAAFAPKILGPDVTNLAMTGGTPLEAFYEVKKLYRCPKPPAVVILSFSPYDWEGHPFFWSRSARFGLLSDDDLNDIARNAAVAKDSVLYHSSFGSEPPPAIKNFLYATHFPPYDAASLLSAALTGHRRRENIRLAKETWANRGQHLIHDNGSVCRTGYTLAAAPPSFLPSPLNVIYFRKIIDFLKSKHVTVLYIGPPVAEVDIRHTGISYLREYVDFINALHREAPSFKIVGSLLPLLNLCDFADAVHVNQDGAEAFSYRVGPMITAALAR